MLSAIPACREHHGCFKSKHNIVVSTCTCRKLQLCCGCHATTASLLRRVPARLENEEDELFGLDSGARRSRDPAAQSLGDVLWSHGRI